MKINLRVAAAVAAISSVLGASAAAVGTQVELTDNLIGYVLTVNGNNHTVGVAANPTNKPTGNLTIAATYFKGDDTYTVTDIYPHGFSTTEIEYLNLPLTVKQIGANAFYGCSKLRSVGLAEPGSVTTINASAFDYCYALTTFDFSGVESIGNFAFRRAGLTSVELPAVKTVGGGAFQECQSLESAVVGDKCTSISNIAFCNCPKLKSVTVNYGVTEVGAQAFAFNVELNDMVVPYTLATAGSNAYFGSALKRVFILSPDFMSYCDASGLLRNRGITDIYCLGSLVDGINSYQNSGSGETTSDLTSKATVHTLYDVVRIDIVNGQGNAFRVTPVLDGITDFKVYTAAGGSEVTPVNGVYRVTGSSAFFSYTVDGVNNLAYPVDDLRAAGVAEVEAAEADSTEALYDLQGRPAGANPAPGLYIRHKASGTDKVLIK